MMGMVTHLTIYGRPGTIAPRVGIGHAIPGCQSCRTDILRVVALFRVVVPGVGQVLPTTDRSIGAEELVEDISVDVKK